MELIFVSYDLQSWGFKKNRQTSEIGPVVVPTDPNNMVQSEKLLLTRIWNEISVFL